MRIATYNKLILHTADLYIERALENECYQREALRSLRTRLMGYKVFHRFSHEEVKQGHELGEDPFMQKLKEVLVATNKHFKFHTDVVKLTDEEVCAMCKYKTDVYSLECGECSRFYGDLFEPIEKEVLDERD